MKHKIWILVLFFLAAGTLFAQQPDKRSIRIVDTMTALEKNNRNPVILRSELDSLIKQYNISQVPTQLKEPVKETSSDIPLYMLAALAVALLLLGWLIYLFYTHQKKINKTIAGLNRQVQYGESHSDPIAMGSPITKGLTEMGKEKNTKNKISAQTLENKISELNAELNKLTKENESLNRVVKEYNGIQHEYDSLKHGISKAYKIKNYPGYEKSKTETTILQGVLETENSVASYAYEKFLKPILAITDANKNNPVRISEDDREKLLDLLVSLSLLYIEYLYLRVNDLSIGGKMVERIHNLKNGNGLDPSLLKQLNTEHGSRALVLRMVLDKAYLQRLTYPVFDETNLNNQ